MSGTLTPAERYNQLADLAASVVVQLSLRLMRERAALRNDAGDEAREAEGAEQ